MIFYINIFLIELIFVIGLDILHFWDEISKIISRIITKGKVVKPFEMKPLSCSTCMGFWTNLFYMFFSHNFSIINTTIILIFAMLAPEIGALIFLFKDWLAKIFQALTPKK